MIHILIIHLRNLAPFLLFLAVVLATAGSRAEELPNLTDKERAWLAQNHSVRVRVTNFAPHIFLDGDEPKGISVDYVNLIAERTGINFVFTEGKGGFWQAVESMGRGDGPDLIVGMESHPERAEEISFSKTYMVAPHVIFTRKESEFVSGIEDLSGKTLAAMRGGPSERLAKEFGDIVMAWFPSERAALEAVSTGQADAYMGDLLVATFVIQSFGYSNLKVAAPGPLGDRRLCFGSRADWPELTSMINKALDSIPRAEQSAVKGKYLSVRYEYGIRTRDIVKWVMIVAGGGLLIVLLFVNWNRQLQRTVEKKTIEIAKGATQLEKSKTQLEEAQRISRSGSFEWDVGADTFIWSKGFYNIVGRDLEKPAPSFAEHPKLFTPESFERLSLAAREAIHSEISYALELELIRDDGEIRSISAVGEPIHDTAGTVIGLRGSVQDITERKRAEDELAMSERLFRATFEQAAVGIAHVAPAGSFRRINQRFCEIVGYSQEEMLAGNFQDITHPDDLEDDVGQVEQLLSGSIKTYSLEKRYVRRDGDLVWVSLTVSLVRNEAGDPEWFVSVIQDISERKRVEQELSLYRERLKELASQLTVTEERERQRIATDLHDHVCQTLALMRLQLATLRKRVTDPNVATSLDDFSASLLQANRDTRHLMFELSSPTLNELGLAAAIAEWLEEELQQRYGLNTEFQNIGLTQYLDQDLRAVLFRNVRELLTNVVKHAQARHVFVILEQTGATITVVVKDDGIGFDQNQTFSRARVGSGFGLFSIQERMADMGGSMKVDTAPGRGCTVTLTLPETS